MKYLQVAQELLKQIQQQSLQTGRKMPSLRRLCDIHNISLTTARNTYEYLEQQGWIYAKPRSGYFVNRPLSDNRLPHTPRFSFQVKQLLANDFFQNLQNQHPFGYARTNPKWFPETAFRQSIKSASQKHLTEICREIHYVGFNKLINTLCHHWQQSGLEIDPNELLITTGCLDAVRVALRACTKEGDAVAITSPSFEGLLQVLALEQRQVIEIPCTSEGLDMEQLELLMQTREIKAALLCSNHLNPLGINLPLEQKQQLAQMAARYQCPIIEDDVYFELGYLDTPMPIKYWDTDGYVLWCASITKTLGEGMRIGWCASGRFSQQVTKAASPVFSQPPLIMQAALAHFINHKQYESHLFKVRARLQQNMAQYRQLLLQNLPETFRISLPEGGMVLWIEAPYSLTHLPFDLYSGTRFTSRQQYSNYCRINYGWPLDAKFNQQVLKEDLIDLSRLLADPKCSFAKRPR